MAAGCGRETRGPGPDADAANPLAAGLVRRDPAATRPAAPASAPRCAIQLHDVTAQSGITFTHHDGSSGKRYVVEAMSTGLATLDYDQDGLTDIYFPNGAPLPGCERDSLPRHALYRNLGDWQFEDVTEQAGVVCTTYGMGATAGDFDADGYPDIYVSNFGPNVLFHNNGDGTFRNVTQELGVGREDIPNAIGAGVACLDIDGDGHLDLYVGNYICLDCDSHQLHYDRGFPAYPSPREYAPIPDTLYRNTGQGFADFSSASGVANYAGRSMGLTCADIENDGDTDVFICNDVMDNFLMINQGDGTFRESAVTAGTALNSQGEMVANMAVDSADFDEDGWIDFYTTNYQGQIPMLFRNLGQAMFDDVATSVGAESGLYPHVNWGCAFVDFNHDGLRDLFIANGHTEDNIEERDRGACHRCPNIVLQHLANGRFVDVTASAGDGLDPIEASRGTAFEDFDNDGDMDGVIMNLRARPTLLQNVLQEEGCASHWLQIRLHGRRTNREGVGSHVVVVTGQRRQLDEVHGGRGYQSHWGTRLHFGLGEASRVDRVEVYWLGAAAEVFEDLPADQLVHLIQGTGQPLDRAAAPGAR
jgi:hypothetical protein